MVAIYTALTNNLPDPQKYPSCLEGLEKKRQEKILQFMQEKDRKLSLGAGLLLHRILPEYGKDTCDIYTNTNGKPLIQGLCFNLSHSEERVLLAISDNDIGCDIEKVTKAPFNIAEHFFCTEERKYLSDMPEGEKKNRDFFRLWAIKESYIKMTGKGLSLPLDSFEARLQEKVGIYRENQPEPCFVREYELGEYQAAVCGEENIAVDRPENVCLI